MGKRERNKEEKRQRLLSVGRECFVKNGFEGTSIEQVIEAAGIGRGTFYLYFSDKEALFVQIVEEIFQPILVILEETHKDLLAHGSDSSAQQIRYIRMAIELATVLESQKLALFIPFREAWSANVAGEALRKWRRELEARAVLIVAEAQRLKLFRDIDANLFVFAITGAIDRVVWAWLNNETNLSRRELAQQLADIFWKGMETR